METKLTKDPVIFLINTLPPPSAVYRYAFDIYSSMHENVGLINVEYDQSRWRNIPEGQIYRARIGNHYIINSFFNKWSVRQLYKFLREQVNLGNFVHYTHESSVPFDLNLSNSIVTVFENPITRLGTDLYSENGKTFSESVNLIFRKMLYNKYKHFQNVITGTEYVKNGMLDFGFDGRIEVLPPPVSKEFFPIENKIELRRELGLPLDKKLILSVSTAAKRKNLKTVLEVSERLGDDFLLVRVGSTIGKDKSFRNVNGEVLNKIYNACDVLLFPTLEEGFGYPLIEAFSVGLPVVSSDIAVVRETAQDAAILTDPLSVVDLARSVKSAISVKDVVVKKGFKRAAFYSFEKFTERQYAYYKSVGVQVF